MENLIYNELKRRGFNINVGIVEKFISNGDKRTRKSFEVDFVCQNYQMLNITFNLHMNYLQKKK
nr:hypothetical protein [Mycoplasmopsis bovis]